MSIEIELKRIADALERIIMPSASTTFSTGPEVVPVATTAQPTPADVKARPVKAKKDPAPAPAPAAPAVAQVQGGVNPEVSKEDVTKALQDFLKKFPGPEGAEKARAFFTAAGAKNITTLDPAKYKDVFLALQAALV